MSPRVVPILDVPVIDTSLDPVTSHFPESESIMNIKFWETIEDSEVGVRWTF